jgi:hypothetical protein
MKIKSAPAVILLMIGLVPGVAQANMQPVVNLSLLHQIILI